MSYRLSVVIPTYRRCESVERALQALCAQTLDAREFEVIVAVDGSEDGTREMAARFHAPFRLSTAFQCNRGRAAACNLGARHASGELLLFLDDDMEPAPKCLAAHSAAHPPGSNRVVLGAVPIVRSAGSAPLTGYIGDKFDRFLDKLAQPNQRIRVRDFFTGNTSMRREVFEEAGRFDEDFRLYGNEDSELAVRLLKIGIEIAFCPEATAHQHYFKSFRELARNHIERGGNELLLAGKHPGMVADLRLGTYELCSTKRRLARASLLRASTLGGAVPELMIRAAAAVAKFGTAESYRYYGFALDYFFWLGVQRAGGQAFMKMGPEPAGSHALRATRP